MRTAPMAAALALCAACQFDTSPMLPPGIHDVSGPVSGPAGQPAAPSAAGASAPPLGPAVPPASSSAGAGAMPAPPSMLPPAAIDAGAPAHDSGSPSEAAADVPDAAVADAGDTGSPVDASAPDAPLAPEPGDLFSACMANSDCDSGFVCTASLTPAMPMPGYCTAWCGQSTDSGNGCAQPNSGEVIASCQFAAICMLESCERLQCPAGLNCVQTATATGFNRFDCMPSRRVGP